MGKKVADPYQKYRYSASGNLPIKAFVNLHFAKYNARQCATNIILLWIIKDVARYMENIRSQEQEVLQRFLILMCFCYYGIGKIQILTKS